MNAGIFASVKAKFRRWLFFWAFDNIDASSKTVYNVDVLTAMRWLEEEWHAVDSMVTRNCWRHCFDFSRNNASADTVCNINSYLKKLVEEDMQGHSVMFTEIGKKSLRNSLNKDFVRVEISFGNLVLSITKYDFAVEKDDAEETEAEAGMYSVKEQLYSLAVTKAVFARDDFKSRKSKKLILDHQRALRLEWQVHMRQTSTSDHFK